MESVVYVLLPSNSVPNQSFTISQVRKILILKGRHSQSLERATAAGETWAAVRSESQRPRALHKQVVKDRTKPVEGSSPTITRIAISGGLGSSDSEKYIWIVLLRLTPK